MSTFNDFVLPDVLREALEKMSFSTPTPIQKEAIPVIMEGKDLIACAQTGTGKTAAFSLPILTHILANPKSKALILAPTRELTNQIAGVLDQLLAYSPQIRGAILIGGAAMNRQIQELRANPAIVIATPGRLLDHMQRRTIDLSKFDTVVLDEADRMFDMGFAEPVDQILNALPEKRQSLLFSATLSKEVISLAQKYMKTPERISIGSVEKPISKIKQTSIQVQGADKNQKMLEELLARGEGQRIIFVRTKVRTDRLAKFLKTNGVKAAAIHGGRTQSQREEALSRFRDGYYSVLVATDLASRGIDVTGIDTVFNFDLPEKYEDYVHRIGRTARAGAEGEAVSFVTPEEQKHWRYLSEGGKYSRDSQPMRRSGGGGRGRGNRPLRFRGHDAKRRSNYSGQSGHSGRSEHSPSSGHSGNFRARPQSDTRAPGKKVSFFKKRPSAPRSSYTIAS